MGRVDWEEESKAPAAIVLGMAAFGIGLSNIGLLAAVGIFLIVIGMAAGKFWYYVYPVAVLAVMGFIAYLMVTAL